MTIEEAIVDPSRPLSISPRDWALSVQAELEEEKSLIDESSKRIASEEDPSSSGRDPEGWEKVDIGIDQMIEGCKIMDQGLFELEEKNLSSSESKKTLSTLRELLNLAIIPYLTEILDTAEGATSRE